MNIELITIEKPVELDEFLDQDEMELPAFEFALVELSQYINGSIKISFRNGLNIIMNLFDDFMVCFDDIIDSINTAKTTHSTKKEIWFCEQGSDFYLIYEVMGTVIDLTFKKGKEVGANNITTPDFSIQIDTFEYIKQWERVFQKLSDLFEKILCKKVEIPIDFN